MKTYYLFLIIFLTSCVSFKVQNDTSYERKCEIVFNGIPLAKRKHFIDILDIYFQKFSKTNLNQKEVYFNDSVKNVCGYFFYIKPNQKIMLTRFLLNCRYYINNSTDTSAFIKLSVTESEKNNNIIFDLTKIIFTNNFERKHKFIKTQETYYIK